MKSSVESPPWSDAVRRLDSAERSEFLEAHLELVKYLALRVAARLPSSVELDDLIHDGILGLLDATDKYDPARGVRFRTYAEARVRGAILDGLRQKDWRPRSVRSMRRNLDQALSELASLHQRPVSEEEIASAMSLSIEAYRTVLVDVNAGPMLSLEELVQEHSAALADARQPDAPLQKRDLLESLAQELRNLPQREQRILELYYHERLNMKEVGAVLGITESRVCQLHSQAAARLRVALRQRLHAVPAGVR